MLFFCGRIIAFRGHASLPTVANGFSGPLNTSLESIPVSSMLEIIYQLERASCTEYDDNAVSLQILLGKGLLKTRRQQWHSPRVVFPYLIHRPFSNGNRKEELKASPPAHGRKRK
jgi:hypothetical protein